MKMRASCDAARLRAEGGSIVSGRAFWLQASS
jgi:hypothetical protein